MLKEQLANAKQQHSELIAASLSEDTGWSAWIASASGATLAVLLIGLWIRRSRR